NLLIFELQSGVAMRERMVPRVPNMTQVGRRRLHGRYLAYIGPASPGKDLGLPVNSRVAEPALGTTDQAARDLGSLESSKLADDPVGLVEPRHAGRTGG